ncbi:MAG: formylglycine-generating enzyme family protein [Massilia sp.]
MHHTFRLALLAGCAGLLSASVAGAEPATLRDTAATPLMVLIPSGSFMMGSRTGEDGREGDEAPRHTVTLSKAFYVSKYEITEAEWDACAAAGKCAALPQHLGPRYPARMNWADAATYLTWLSAETGKHYRALTEAEWEYAARAGTDTAYPFGDTITPANANYVQSRKDAPVEVGSYPANRFGLHDMIGNVWEWVEDCYHSGGYYDARADGQPVVRDKCPVHAVRGGSYQIRAQQSRVSYRFRVFKNDGDVGLRVARDER